MAAGGDDSQKGLRVFISYRRQDVPGYAGRLYDHLALRFGDDRVFMDVDAIRPGSDFTQVIDGALAKCDVFLAVIGDGWLTSTDSTGRRRLDAPGDFVRLELEAAFRRDIPIIPLLFESATMPPATDLPESLAPLARRQALEMSDTRWRADVDELVTELDRLVKGQSPEPAPVVPTPPPAPAPARAGAVPGLRLPPRRTLAFIAGAIVLTLLGIGVGVNMDKDALDTPRGIAVGPGGVVYVADKARIFRIGRDGGIEPFAGGKRGAEKYGDGGPASGAEFADPRGLAFADGSLYIADHYHSMIRRITADGTVTTFVGSNGSGFGGDDGPAARAKLLAARGVGVGNDGALYIADSENHRIRRASNGIVTTVAGNGIAGFGGDELPAEDAFLSKPEAVAVTADGVLYIADTANHRIRRVDASGTITTVAGTGEPAFRGEGEPAKDAALNLPTGLAVGPGGELYVADLGNNRIRKIAGGTITTVAGDGRSGYSGDGGQARRASLNSPYGVGLKPDGTVVFSDSGNNQVRTVAPNGVISTAG